MNTMLKPSTNAKPVAITEPRPAAVMLPPGAEAPASAACPARPPRYAAYAGIKGKTQGERNETRPARKASGMVTVMIRVTRKEEQSRRSGHIVMGPPTSVKKYQYNN